MSEYKCMCCPVEVRSLFAYAHNLVVLYESKDIERINRKLHENLAGLKNAVQTLQPIIDLHFAAYHGEGIPRSIPEMVEGMPRRCRVDLATAPEKAIRDAMSAVEAAGASTALTDAVLLLGQALERVADHVEAEALAE